MKKEQKKIIIYEISLCSILLALTIVVKAIFKYIDIINGYSLQIQMLIFSYSLYFIRTYPFKIGFLILVPFALLVFGINGHIFFDYILPYWGFFAFIFLAKIINHQPKDLDEKKRKIIYLSKLYGFSLLFNLIGYSIMLISYFLSGKIFYQVSDYNSLIINGPIVGISAAVNISLMMLTIYPLTLLNTNINTKIFY